MKVVHTSMFVCCVYIYNTYIIIIYIYIHVIICYYIHIYICNYIHISYTHNPQDLPYIPMKIGESFHGNTRQLLHAAERQEMWYQVVHKPAVMIREQPDEKAMAGGCTPV